MQFSIHPSCLRRPLRDRRVMLGSRFEAGPHHNNISPTACGAGSPSGKGKGPRDSLPAERRDERNGERRGSGERQPPWRGLARTNSRMWCSASPLLSFVCPCFSLFAFSSPPYQSPSSAPVRLRLAWRWRRSFACSWRRRYTESWRRRPARRPGGWVRPVRPRSRAPCAPARWRLRGPRSPACPCSGTPRPR